MEIYTNQIKEWTDYENQYKIAVAAVKWLDKHLKIVHGKRERNVELTYGLPYTSSGEYAAIWNTNVDARSNDDLTLQFKGVALDKDNNPVIIWYMTDCDGWRYTTMKNFNGTLTEITNENKNIKNEKENRTMKTYDEKVQAIKNIIEGMDDSDAVALHNEYCYKTNDYDDEIIEMERFDEICEGMTPSDIARSIVYGDFNPNHDYFHFNGCGNFESTDCPTDWIYPGDIAREVVDRECAFENDEIQEEIDSWSEDKDEEEN